MNLKVVIVKEWYRWLLFIDIFAIQIISIIQFMNYGRLFSLVYIVLCILIMGSMYLSYKYFKIAVKIYSILLIVSSGLILFGALMHLGSGAYHKILIKNNTYALVNLVIGIVLIKYMNSSIQKPTTDRIS